MIDDFPIENLVQLRAFGHAQDPASAVVIAETEAGVERYFALPRGRLASLVDQLARDARGLQEAR